ncbi:hypothetical protein [Jeotgalibacillus proteolyticus]|uniref:Ribbon-helix-helix protein CopG domain-containing protein n=1 Tax=Jeotgalibacillus proteolyticus TaxID=2082395 RepID=A0A2S5G615_9BACL|nr:hypothetical protein [Jeotgalibacillus proteolyticus]PPA68429.1 hypothetical protein C4B60_20915 [Jeotgalibacillus proteolyticus]
MEILIRNVDPIAIKKLDEIAKKKNISRQLFLKAIIEKAAYEQIQSEKENRLEIIIERNIIAMEKMTNLIVELTEE